MASVGTPLFMAFVSCLGPVSGTVRCFRNGRHVLLYRAVVNEELIIESGVSAIVGLRDCDMVFTQSERNQSYVSVNAWNHQLEGFSAFAALFGSSGATGDRVYVYVCMYAFI